MIENFPTQKCAICDNQIHLDLRYPNNVCTSCMTQSICSTHEKAVRLSNGTVNGTGIQLTHIKDITICDSSVGYDIDTLVLIGDIICSVQEHYFGGIVVQAIKGDN